MKQFFFQCALLEARQGILELRLNWLLHKMSHIAKQPSRRERERKTHVFANNKARFDDMLSLVTIFPYSPVWLLCFPHRHQSHIKRNNCFPVRFFFIPSLSLSLFTGCSSVNADNDLDGRALHCRYFVANTRRRREIFHQPFLKRLPSLFSVEGKVCRKPQKATKISPTSKTVSLLY